jgi:glycosyltransferase involved in cell wall biosynthesis
MTWPTAAATPECLRLPTQISSRLTEPLAVTSITIPNAPARSTREFVREPIRVGFVMHVMQVAGAEVLVARIIRELRGQIEPTIFCLDQVGVLGEQLLQEGIEVVCLNRRPGRDWGVAKRLADAVRARRVELLHAHQYTPFFYSALARWRGAKSTQIIFTEHGRHYPDHVSAARRWGNRLVLSHAPAHVNACCQFSAQALHDVDGFRRNDIEVIYNGIDSQMFAPSEDRQVLRSRLGLENGRRYIGSVARFHPVKDHKTLLRAFVHVAADRDDVDLLLVGDGPMRDMLEGMVHEFELSDRVHFLGLRHDVPALLQAIDVFTLPSLSEAASLTLLEAMSCACPVVVTAVGGNGEIVRAGRDGLLTPRQDPAALARALLQVLNDPDRARTMGQSARERVVTTFQQRDTVKRFADLYRELARPQSVPQRGAE